jgi:hypothetical protein
MHNYPLNAGSHGQEFENSLRLVMENNEQELDQEWWDSQAILIKN